MSSEWSDLLSSLAGLGIGGGEGGAEAAGVASAGAEPAAPAPAFLLSPRSTSPSPLERTAPSSSHLAPFFDFASFHGVDHVRLISKMNRKSKEGAERDDTRRG